MISSMKETKHILQATVKFHVEQNPGNTDHLRSVAERYLNSKGINSDYMTVEIW